MNFPFQKVLFASLLIIASPLSYAQNPNCAVGTSRMQIESGNIRATLLNAGDMFWDPSASLPKFQWPKNASVNRHLLFNSSLWFGGVDSVTNNVLTAVQTYRAQLRNFWPGPITDEFDPGETSSAVCNLWNQHFKVDRVSLDSFLLAVQNNPLPLPESAMPFQIKNWPGKGNAYLKSWAASQGVVDLRSFDQHLAPFVDVNSNQIYDPQNGDYPDLRNRSSMVWWVINDIGNQKNYVQNTTVVPGIGLEIQIMASTYPALNEQHYLENSVFLDYSILNKGVRIVKNSYLGLFVDFEIGYANDDYTQCDVLRNMAIGYNGDSLDEGVTGYGANPPAFAVKILDGPGPLSENDGIDNNRNNVTDEPGEQKIMSGYMPYNIGASPVNGDPNNFNEFYNYLRGKWKSGLDMTYGGNGTNPTSPSSPKANYMYPGSSDPYGISVNGTVQNPVALPEWTERTAANPPGDRRGLVRSGPFTMYPGDFIKYSAVTLVGFGGTIQQNISQLASISDSLDNFLPTLTSTLTLKTDPSFTATLSPNPASETIRINAGKHQSRILITDIQGKEILRQSDYTSFTDLDIRKLGKGIYLVHIENRERSRTLKLIVDK